MDIQVNQTGLGNSASGVAYIQAYHISTTAARNNSYIYDMDLFNNLSLTTLATTDDPELVRAQHHLAIIRILVQKVLSPVVVIFGVVGNILNIAVLTRRWMRSSTNCYLTALAVSDTMYLILAFLMALMHYGQMFRPPSPYSMFLYLVARPFLGVFSNTGVWMTVTFTMERYVGVRYPMKGKVLCTPQRARYVIAIVTFFVITLTLPEFFVARLKYSTETNQTILVGTEMASKASYKVGYNLTNQMVFTFIPLVLLITFNSLLIKTVWQANKQRRAMTKVVVVQNDKTEKHHREQHRITTMLIVVVLVFLVCQTPQGVANLCFFISDTFSSTPVTPLTEAKRSIVGNICNLLVTINCSCNFVLYSSFSVKFRRTFKKLFCRCLPRRYRQDFIFSDVLSHYSQHGNQATVTRSSRIPSSPRLTPRNSVVVDTNVAPKKHKNGYLAVPTENNYPKGVNLFISKL